MSEETAPSVSWYYLYSYWVIILVILQFCNSISFSVIPSIIMVCFGMIGFYIWKHMIGVPMNMTYVFIQLVIHFTPFLILPFKFSYRDILINLSIFCVYLLILYINSIDIYDTYRQVAYENGNVTVWSFLKNRNIFR